jgi:hypothetical protein
VDAVVYSIPFRDLEVLFEEDTSPNRALEAALWEDRNESYTMYRK